MKKYAYSICDSLVSWIGPVSTIDEAVKRGEELATETGNQQFYIRQIQPLAEAIFPKISFDDIIEHLRFNGEKRLLVTAKNSAYYKHEFDRACDLEDEIFEIIKKWIKRNKLQSAWVDFGDKQTFTL